MLVLPNFLILIFCLSEVSVGVGDSGKQNDVIGVSGKVNIDKGYENALLFEYQSEYNSFYRRRRRSSLC